MKFFSLLTDEIVTPAPDAKVIPKKDFEALLSAKELLTETEEQHEEFLERLEQERQSALEKGYEDGYQKGLESLNEHIIALNEEMKTIRLAMQQKIVPIALKAAQRIVGNALDMKPETVVDIVQQALIPAKEAHEIKIYVAKEDMARIEKAKSTLRKTLDHVELFVVEQRADISPGGCVIETENGIINATIENQWKALEGALKKVLK